MQSLQAHLSSRAGHTPLDPRSAFANIAIGVMVNAPSETAPLRATLDRALPRDAARVGRYGGWPRIPLCVGAQDECMTALAASGLRPALVTRSERGASKMWRTRMLAARSSDV